MSVLAFVLAVIPYTLNVPVSLSNFQPSQHVSVNCIGYRGANQTGGQVSPIPATKRVMVTNGSYSGTMTFKFNSPAPLLSYKCQLLIDGVEKFSSANGWSGNQTTTANFPKP